MRWLLICAFMLPTTALAEASFQPIIPNLIAPRADGAEIAVQVTPGLRSSKRLRSAELRKARADFHAGAVTPAATMRQLAEAGDGLAAQRYVRLLEADPSADPSDIAYFAAIAVSTGRVWTMRTMIDAMHRLDPEKEPWERVRRHIRALYPHAWAGNNLALRAVVDFNGEGRLFGPLTEKTRQRILSEAREQGDGRIELGMALAILEREYGSAAPSSAALAEAKTLLEGARDVEHLAVRTTAQNMLRLMEVRSKAEQ